MLGVFTKKLTKIFFLPFDTRVFFDFLFKKFYPNFHKLSSFKVFILNFSFISVHLNIQVHSIYQIYIPKHKEITKIQTKKRKLGLS